MAALIRLNGKWGAEASYFVAFNVTNALNYAYLVAMGLLLGTEPCGLFGALFGLVYLVSALRNTVQLAVARHIASLQVAQRGVVSRQMLAEAFVPASIVAAIVGLVFLSLSPVLAGTFHSPTEPLLWTGLAAALSVLVPAGYGILQGAQRFVWLGTSLLTAAVFRIAAGGALVAAGWGPSGALAGVAIGYAASGLVALVPADETASERRPQINGPSAMSLAAILVASVAVAVPTSLDVALVRHFFPALEAGMFTAVAVLGRVVLFVPLAVSFIVLPKVTTRISRGGDPSGFLWGSLGLTGGLSGGAAAALMLVTSGLGWSPVGSDISGALAPLRWYLPAMVAFALVVASVYYQIGCGNSSHVFALLVPGIAGQALLIVLFHDSLTTVAQMMFAVNVVLLAASMIQAALPRVRAEYVRRLLPRWGAHQHLGPELPPND